MSFECWASQCVTMTHKWSVTKGHVNAWLTTSSIFSRYGKLLRMCSWNTIWITAPERHNKQLGYKSSPVLCHSSPRGICHLSLWTTLLWWSSRHAPQSHTWGKSWERCHRRDKGPPEREQKKSNIIQSQNLGLQTPTFMTFPLSHTWWQDSRFSAQLFFYPSSHWWT